MARKAAKSQDANESKDTPITESGRESHGRVAPVSKSEAIRKALAAGFEGPQEGSAYIRSQFGLDVGPRHFSAVKAHEKSKDTAVSKGRPPARRGRPRSIEGILSAPKLQVPATGEGELIAALEAMKPLVASLGVDKVKRIAELLG